MCNTVLGGKKNGECQQQVRCPRILLEEDHLKSQIPRDAATLPPPEGFFLGGKASFALCSYKQSLSVVWSLSEHWVSPGGCSRVGMLTSPHPMGTWKGNEKEARVPPRHCG